MNVFELMKEDHRKIEQLFTSFKETDARSRKRLADEALSALEIHSRIEEKLVYPAIRGALHETEMMAEATEEHHVVTFLIKELRKMKPSSERYRTKFRVLSKLVEAHVKEEEERMFPQAERNNVDWDKLGQELMKIKARMMKSFYNHRRAA